MANSDQQKDKQLIEAIRDGNELAFEKLFLKYYQPLCNFIWRYTRSSHISEELVQDVFEELWKRLTMLDAQQSIRSYLYQAVKNKALDHIKHQKVANQYRSEVRHTRERAVHQKRSQPEDTEFLKAARQAIEELPERARQTYKLHRKDGLTYREIADVMGVSVKTVESQMSRALQILRRRLEKYLPLLTTLSFSVFPFLY